MYKPKAIWKYFQNFIWKSFINYIANTFTLIKIFPTNLFSLIVAVVLAFIAILIGI